MSNPISKKIAFSHNSNNMQMGGGGNDKITDKMLEELASTIFAVSEDK